MGGPTDVEGAGAARPSLRDLFTGFLFLGLTGFGGVLPLARRSIVERRRWLTPDEFTDLLGLAQFMPGGNIVNMSVGIGMRFHGARGALAAITGLMAVPTVVVIGLGTVFDRYRDAPSVRHVFVGLAAAACGLLIAMAVRIARPLWGRPLAIGLAVLCVLAVAVVRAPLPLTLLVMAPLSLALTAAFSR